MKKLLTIGVVIFAVCQLWGQDISFSLEIDQDTVKVGELLTVTYKLTGARGDFETPEFSGLRLVGGPNYSSQISIVQGQMDQVCTYSYVFQPLEEGDIYIPEAQVKVDGKVYTSPSSSVFVTSNPEWSPNKKRPEVPSKKNYGKKKNVTEI